MAEHVNQHYADGIIDEEEYLILLELQGELNAPQEEEHNRNRVWERFNFDLWTDADCWTDLGFRKIDIPRLCNASILMKK